MFVTYPHFKHPFQFDQRATNYGSIELFLLHAWFLVTIEVPEEEQVRTFAIGDPRDVAEIARTGAGGRLLAASLALPPSNPMHADWRLVRLREIAQTFGSEHEPPEVVVTDEEGLNWGSFPLPKVLARGAPLSTLASLAI